MSMEGAVLIVTSDGYQLNARRVDVKLDQTWAFAHGPVEGISRSGTLVAGSMEIKRSLRTNAVKYYFNGGVKIIYDGDK